MQRRLLRLLLGGLLTLALVLAVVLWLASCEATLRWALQKAVVASTGALEVAGVSGSLYGPIQIAHLSYLDKQWQLRAEQLTIKWSPLRLLKRELRIDELAAAALTLNFIEVSRDPPNLPESLLLPLRLQIDSANIARFGIKFVSRNYAINGLRFILQADSRSWRVQNLQAATPWGGLTAGLVLDAVKPYALQSNAHSQSDAERWAHRADATASGTLSDLRIVVSVHSQGAVAELDLTLAPFALNALKGAQLIAHDIDPSRFEQRLPRADLEARLAARDENGVLEGSVKIINHSPGKLDQQLLPVASASASITGDLAAIKFSDIVLDGGTAGTFTGTGALQDGKLELALATRKLDLNAIVDKLRPTAIAGSIALATDGKTQRLRAELAQERFLLELAADWVDSALKVRRAVVRSGASEVSLTGEVSLNGARKFDARGTVKRFNPADFGAYPAADINSEIYLSGRIASEWQVAADLSLQPSRLFKQPLSGGGKFEADAKHVRAVDARLKLGNNSLQLRGSFGANNDKIDWRIDANQLALFGPDLAGALTATGTLTGSVQVPQLTFAAQARGLRWGGAKPRITNTSLLQASGEVMLAGTREFKLSGAAQRIRSGSLWRLPERQHQRRLFDRRPRRSQLAAHCRHRAAAEPAHEPAAIGLCQIQSEPQ